jgi:DNA-binding response OmpR family regulator
MAKVLIVEDEPHLRLLYELDLRRAGFEVACAASSEGCLSCLGRTHPDVVVLDIMMPGKDGIETLSQLRIRDKALPVILYTAYGSYRDNYLTWAADECLIKSADTSELIETVRRLAAPHETHESVCHAAGGRPAVASKKGTAASRAPAPYMELLTSP